FSCFLASTVSSFPPSLFTIAGLTAIVWAVTTLPYEATVDAAGDVAFLAVLRTKRVNVRDIRRIVVRRSEQGRTVIFRWDEGEAVMSSKRGDALADYLREMTPSIAEDR